MFGLKLFTAVFPVLFLLMFLLVMGTFAAELIRGFRNRRRDDQSPRLKVDAKVVAKRDQYRRSSRNGHTHHSPRYFVTFEVESGDRMELELKGPEYGLLVEGDTGKLSFQGNRYLGFERT